MSELLPQDRRERAGPSAGAQRQSEQDEHARSRHRGLLHGAGADGKPHLLGGHCPTCGAFFFPKQYSFCRNPTCQRARPRRRRAVGTRGTLWSFTDNRYAPPPPYPALEPFEPYGVAAVELAEEQMIVLGQVAPRHRHGRAARRAGDGARRRGLLRDATASPHRVEVEGRLMREPAIRSSSWARACTPGGSGAATSSSTAWSRHVAALADAGLEWSDVQFLAAGNTMRNGYPGYVSGSTFAQALGWQRHRARRAATPRARRARWRSTRPGPRSSAGARRRRARRRRRHRAEGLLRPAPRRAARRPRLAALPRARRDEPHVLRAVRAPPHGAVRRVARRTSRRSR